MNVLEDRQSCCGCQSCYNVCPVHAIRMRTDEEGFSYPEIEEAECIHCGLCREACPVLAPPALNPLTDVFAGYAADEQERMSSSSGGVFAALARSVLNAGGAVCGAAFDDDLSVRHVLIDSPSELSKIKGTKYVQSETGRQFASIRERLEKEQTVLFSGTPCQVAGLKAFLGRKYDTLICVDLICHGVPSPLVWQRYLEDISDGSTVVRAAFRCKHEGSDAAFIRFWFENGDIREEPQSDDLYMKGFLRNYYVRPACFSCRFKGLERCSDLTIGDFWSIKEYHPQFADVYGNSAVLVHSPKGKRLLEDAAKNLKLEKATSQEVLLWNECLVESVAQTQKREAFFQRWRTESLCDVIADLSREEPSVKSQNPDILTRLKRKLKRFAKNIHL